MYVALLRQLMACRKKITIKTCQQFEICKSKLYLWRKNTTLSRMQIKITPVRTTPEEFENGGFAPGPAENASNDFRPFWICDWGKLGQGNHVIIVTSLFSKISVIKMFSVHTKNEKPVFSNSSSSKSVFVKLHFRVRLVWTEGLAVETKLCFQIPPA